MRERTKEYVCYHAMKQRCYNPNVKAYYRYGGRGIIVCDRWLESFENFLEDMGLKPTTNHTLERVDFDGNYCKENCVWVEAEKQQTNTSFNIKIEIGGITKCASEWAREKGINRHCVQSRLRKGMSPILAVTQPSDTNHYKPEPIMITCRGKTMTLTQWSKKTGLAKSTIWNRIFRDGMSQEEAILKPSTRPKK